VSEQAARTKPLTKEVIARADDEAPPPEETAVAQLEKMLRSQAENDPALKAAFEQLDALAKTREGDAKAVEAAAACILARTI
jgi:hypothetical protein